MRTAALLVFSLTSSWANAGLAASIQRATPPVIASATVDADRRTMVVSGWHFGEGSAVVALDDRVLRIKSHPIASWSPSSPRISLPAAIADSRSAHAVT
jgi:hypothetical protein